MSASQMMLSISAFVNLWPNLLKRAPSSAASILPSPLESKILNARCRSAASDFLEYFSYALRNNLLYVLLDYREF